MPPHEDEFTGGQLYIKSHDGQYTSFMDIQDCTSTIAADLDNDKQEWKNTDVSLPYNDEFTVTCYMNKHDSRRFWKVMRRLNNKGTRIRHHEIRMKDRARRSVLKKQDWFVLRDKDGGQVCIDWHKRPDEEGRFFIRYKRKRVAT